MKKHKITSLILFFVLFGCSSVQSAPTSTPVPVNPNQSMESLNISVTLTTIPENVLPEITTTFKDGHIVISGFQPTIFHWLHWSKDGKTLLIGTQDDGVIIYNIANKKARTINSDDDMIFMRFEISPDEKILAAAGYATNPIRLFNPETGELIKALHIPYYWPGSLAFNKDGTILAAMNTRDGKIFLWDIASGKEIKQIIKSDNEYGRLSFNPDGTLLMISNMGNLCRVWDTNTWEIQKTFSGNCGWFSSFDSNVHDIFLISTNETNTRAVWDFNSEKKLFNISITQPQIRAVAYDSNGKYIAASGANGGNTTINNSITIFDANTGKYLQELPFGYFGQAIALAFNPDGTQLASLHQVDGDGEVIIWNINQP